MPTTKLSGADLLTPSETSEYLGVKPQTLAFWRCTGRHGLPYIKAGNAVRYRRADLEAWLAARTVTSTGQSDAAGI